MLIFPIHLGSPLETHSIENKFYSENVRRNLHAFLSARFWNYNHPLSALMDLRKLRMLIVLPGLTLGTNYTFLEHQFNSSSQKVLTEIPEPILQASSRQICEIFRNIMHTNINHCYLIFLNMYMLCVLKILHMVLNERS